MTSFPVIFADVILFMAPLEQKWVSERSQACNEKQSYEVKQVINTWGNQRKFCRNGQRGEKVTRVLGKSESNDNQTYPPKSLKNCRNQNIGEDNQQENSVR